MSFAFINFNVSRSNNTAPLLSTMQSAHGHTVAAGRIAGALRRTGRGDEADAIVRKMKTADYDVREKDPFADIARVIPLAIDTPPLAARINSAWIEHRRTIIDLFPAEPRLPDDASVCLAKVDDSYVNDAYYSLSIEGYFVTAELIEPVRQGSFDLLEIRHISKISTHLQREVIGRSSRLSELCLKKLSPDQSGPVAVLFRSFDAKNAPKERNYGTNTHGRI